MTINKYIGSRYVPMYIGVHDKNRSYEPLSIVSNEAKTETYTSTKAVPVGIELDNESYWVQSGWSNADMKIVTVTDFVDSATDSNLSAEKTDDGYKLRLSDSNAFASGGTLDTAQTLNTMLDTGRYIFKPIDCAGVPDAIASLETPAELEITDYLATEGASAQLMQKITAYDDDDAAMFVRTYDNEKWSDWKMIGGNGGGSSYTLPIASADTLGGIKIGSGLEIDSTGKVTVDASTVGSWNDIKSQLTANKGTINAATCNETLHSVKINITTESYVIQTLDAFTIDNSTAAAILNISGLPKPYISDKFIGEFSNTIQITSPTLGQASIYVSPDGVLRIKDLFFYKDITQSSSFTLSAVSFEYTY